MCVLSFTFCNPQSKTCFSSAQTQEPRLMGRQEKSQKDSDGHSEGNRRRRRSSLFLQSSGQMSRAAVTVCEDDKDLAEKDKSLAQMFPNAV